MYGPRQFGGLGLGWGDICKGGDGRRGQLTVCLFDGTPVGTMYYFYDDRYWRSWFIDLICAATRVGAGSLLVRHLQDQVQQPHHQHAQRSPTIRLVPVSDAVSFYEKLGFVSSSYWMEWHAERMRTAPSGITSTSS